MDLFPQSKVVAVKSLSSVCDVTAKLSGCQLNMIDLLFILCARWTSSVLFRCDVPYPIIRKLNSSLYLFISGCSPHHLFSSWASAENRRFQETWRPGHGRISFFIQPKTKLTKLLNKAVCIFFVCLECIVRLCSLLQFILLDYYYLG